jgi:hypothetical protein
MGRCGDSRFIVHVDCHSGYRNDERPHRIRIGGTDLLVREILDRWYDPDAGYFKLLCEDGNVYIVRNEFAGGRWTLTHFKKSGSGTSA